MQELLGNMPVRFPVVSSEAFQVFKGQAMGAAAAAGNASKPNFLKGQPTLLPLTYTLTTSLVGGMKSVNLFDLSGKSRRNRPRPSHNSSGLWLDFSLMEAPLVCFISTCPRGIASVTGS